MTIAGAPLASPPPALSDGFSEFVTTHSVPSGPVVIRGSVHGKPGAIFWTFTLDHLGGAACAAPAHASTAMPSRTAPRRRRSLTGRPPLRGAGVYASGGAGDEDPVILGATLGVTPGGVVITGTHRLCTAELGVRFPPPPSARAAFIPRMSLGRDFRWLWTAFAVSTVGTWLAFDAFPLIAILVLHSGPGQVSLLAAAGLAVGALVAVPLGPWVEFRRKRRVMIAMDLVRFCALLSVPAA